MFSSARFSHSECLVRLPRLDLRHGPWPYARACTAIQNSWGRKSATVDPYPHHPKRAAGGKNNCGRSCPAQSLSEHTNVNHTTEDYEQEAPNSEFMFLLSTWTDGAVTCIRTHHLSLTNHVLCLAHKASRCAHHKTLSSRRGPCNERPETN